MNDFIMFVCFSLITLRLFQKKFKDSIFILILYYLAVYLFISLFELLIWFDFFLMRFFSYSFIDFTKYYTFISMVGYVMEIFMFLIGLSFISLFLKLKLQKKENIKIFSKDYLLNTFIIIFCYFVTLLVWYLTWLTSYNLPLTI